VTRRLSRELQEIILYIMVACREATSLVLVFCVFHGAAVRACAITALCSTPQRSVDCNPTENLVFGNMIASSKTSEDSTAVLPSLPRLHAMISKVGLCSNSSTSFSISSTSCRRAHHNFALYHQLKHLGAAKSMIPAYVSSCCFWNLLRSFSSINSQALRIGTA
jgi:hypothetical protein